MKNERLLLEVQERRHPGHQQHERRDAEQVGRAHHLHECGEHPAADRAVRAWRSGPLGHRGRARRSARPLPSLPTDDLRHEQQRHQQQSCGERQQIDGTERHGELAVDERANQPAAAGARPDETEQAPRLLAAEHVRHQAPERRHH
ncbi:MAG: hypothetical protein E6K50_10570, partial [Gammaproteobacteria bacterium]